MSGDGGALTAQVEAVVQRLMDDPAAGPTAAELAHAAEVELPPGGLSMGQMVAASGLSEHALRYYERLGLVRVERSDAGQRVYGAEAVQRIFLVTRMRLSGMPMATLGRLTRLLDERGVDDPEVRELLTDHRDQLRRHIAELQVALAITEFKLASGRLEPAVAARV